MHGLDRSYKSILCWLVSGLTILLWMGAAEASEKGRALGNCGDEVRAGFHFYCDPDAVAEEEPAPPPPKREPEPKPEPETQTEVTTVTVQSATEEMMAFRKNLDELKHEAILRPSEASVQAYMTAQKEMVDIAGRFTDQWQRILFKTPALDANVDYPLTNLGATVFQDRKREVEVASLLEAAETRGLIFVFSHENSCAVCPTQASIVADMMKKYDIEVLAITTDGWAYEQFPQPLPDNGQLADLGLGDYPKPILGLVDPATGAVDVIGAGLLAADQIIERIHLITKVPAGERYSEGLK